MLVLDRAPLESITVSNGKEEFEFKILSIRGLNAKIGIKAPKEYRIWRTEKEGFRNDFIFKKGS
jgi:carbon storage regulator CsrA